MTMANQFNTADEKTLEFYSENEMQSLHIEVADEIVKEDYANAETWIQRQYGDEGLENFQSILAERCEEYNCGQSEIIQEWANSEVEYQIRNISVN